MRLVTLFLVAAFATSTVDAASYQKTDGTIVDPIRLTHGGPHSYSGVNLESGANLTGADLNGANLTNANLTNANLTNANLTGANLTGADLNGADLNGSNLTAARYWEYAYWTNAYYYADNVPTWGSGMDQA